MNLADKKEQLVRQQQLKEKKIEELKNEITETGEIQTSLEERIYSLSIDNKKRSDDKDLLLMLLP